MLPRSIASIALMAALMMLAPSAWVFDKSKYLGRNRRGQNVVLVGPNLGSDFHVK